MGKFKNFIEEQKTDLKTLLYNYTFTIIAVALVSVIFCIELELDKTPDAIGNMELFLLIFAVGAVFIETYFVDKDQPKKWGRLAMFYVVDGFLAAIWTIIGHFDEEIANAFDNPDVYYLNISKILAVYIVALVAATIYKLVKLSGLEFDTYISRAIFGLIKMWGLFLVLYLAICLLLSIFDSLIMEIDYWDIIDNVSVLLCGFVCFPYSLLMIADTKDENSKFTKGLINIALMPAVIIALVMVYVYIIKIIFTWSMPSNEAFNICLYVFILGGPVWFKSYGFLREKALEKGEELGIYGKIVKNMKYAYAPLIILELLAIGIRIASYGLTTDRYMAIVAVSFQIIYVLWNVIGKLIKKELKEEGLIYVGLVIFVFAMLFPGLNMDKLPANIQIARFEDALDREDYLDEKFTTSERKELELKFNEYIEEENAYNHTEYVNAYVPTADKGYGVMIEGFTHIYEFNYYGDYDEYYTLEELESLTFTYGASFEVNADVSSVVEYAIAIKEDDLNYSQEMKYYYLDLERSF